MDHYIASVQGHYGCGFDVRRLSSQPYHSCDITVVTCRLPRPISADHADQLDDLVSSVVDVGKQDAATADRTRRMVIVMEVLRAKRPSSAAFAVRAPMKEESDGECVVYIARDAYGRIRVRRCGWGHRPDEVADLYSCM